MATLYLKTAGGNWSAASTWSNVNASGGDNSGPPTAADNVVLELLSGNVTLDVTPVCRSLDCTSGTGNYAGVMTHNAATTLTIGDGTAGAGNVALKFTAGMTYTLGNATSSEITLLSTSTTQQTITTAGKTCANVNVNGLAGTWKLLDALNLGPAQLYILKGALDCNAQTVTIGAFFTNGSSVRSLTTGAGTWTITGGIGSAWDSSSSTNFTLTATGSTITFNASVSGLLGGGLAGFGTVVVSGVTTFTYSGANTFQTFTITGPASKTPTFTMGAAMTVSGTFTVTGNSLTNRVLIQSSVIGTSRTITAAVATLSNADFSDITAAGAASPFGGTSMGNALGNTNITFDAPVTQTHTASAGGNWSDATKWTSRVPLPQDNVVVDVNTTGTLTADMPRLGANLTFTGFAGTLALSTTQGSFGNITLASGSTITGSTTFSLFGRGSHTFTSAGKTFGTAEALTINAPGGTYTLQDALTIPGTSAICLNLAMGTLTDNGFSVALTGGFNASASTTVNKSGAWTSALTAGFFWSVNASATVNDTGSLTLTVASASGRSFGGGGKTYNILTYTVAGSTGSLTITGSNTFNTINFSDVSNARSLLFTAGTTTTITGTSGFNVNGTAGKLMTIDSVTAATHTLSKASGIVSSDYLSISHSTATGGAGWYAGANSTDGGNNSGWIFTVPPTGGTMLMMGI